MKKTLILSVLIFSPPVFAHDLDNHKIHGFISTNLAAKTVSEGALWYMQTRHRVPVVFSDDLRAQTLATIAAVRELLNSGQTPPPDYGKRCKACSLVEICQPELLGKRDKSKNYIEELFL